MSKNLSEVFFSIKKSQHLLNSFLEKPIVIVLNQCSKIEEFDAPIYAGILEYVEENCIYLKNPYEFDDEQWVCGCPDQFIKLDPVREDQNIKVFPKLSFELIDSIYSPKVKLRLEQVCDIWSDPRDFIQVEHEIG